MNRRGFTIYFIFLILFLILFSGFMSQSAEIINLASMQRRLISREGGVQPGYNWYLHLLREPVERSDD
ncbi:MAG: hypothetical protein KKB51_10915 [Candidatus Riflebacteria bacterium]|nr:hypothetical protein [Candidatus Riflebacteria bacterium]